MNDDARPGVWIGHVSIRTRDLAGTERFMKDVGMRPIFSGDEVAVLELRGGTHLVVVHDPAHEAGDAGFDLMYEDLAATRERFAAQGFAVSAVESGRIHDAFFVTEPGGNRIKVNSTHVKDHASV